MAPPFRADQIGSLIRPQALLDLDNTGYSVSNYATNKPSHINTATQQAIADVVKQQLAHGIRPITTGEFERKIFYSGFFEKLSGTEVRLIEREGWRSQFAPVRVTGGSRPACIATGKIEWTRSAYLDDWNYLKSLLPQNLWGKCKWTLPPPTQMSIGLKPGTAFEASSGYKDEREYFADLTAAYRKEIRALYDAGLRNIQVDDPHFTFFLTDWYQQGLKEDGQDWDELLEMYIWAHNQLLKDAPDDLHIGLHLCRGNFGKTHFATGSYEPLAQKLFQKLGYHTYYLEYDTERAGSFEPLRHLPIGKNVVLGVVSTKTEELENVEECVGRVHEAAAIIAEAQGRKKEDVLEDTLGVSPQCGFASVAFGKQMTEEREFEKLVLVRTIAQTIWPDTKSS